MVASICLDRASAEPSPVGPFAFADFLERGIIVSTMVHQDLSFLGTPYLRGFSAGFESGRIGVVDERV